MTGLIRLGLCLGLLLATAPATAQTQGTGATDGAQSQAGQSGRPLPRFVSLRAPKVNLRTGPGIRYPIDWVYTRKGMPLEIIDEFETWRRIRDWQGSIGWVHQSMLSNRRGALVVGRQRLMRRAPKDGAPVMALVEAGVVGRLLGCGGGWCRIAVKGFEGWLKEKEIYGAHPGETAE